MQENEDVLDWDFCLENPPLKPARVVEVIFEKTKLSKSGKMDSVLSAKTVGKSRVSFYTLLRLISLCSVSWLPMVFALTNSGT